MRIAAAVLIIAVALTACEPAPTAVTTPSPSVLPTLAVTAAPGTAAPSPTPAATGRPGIRATAAGVVPDAFRYVAVDTDIVDARHTRLWLVDLAGTRGAAVIAEWDAPASPIGGWSASADGKSLVISAAGARSRAALYLFRPETAEVRVLFEDPKEIVISPRLSPDGQRYAFTKYPADGGADLGVWSGTITGDVGRIAGPTDGSSVPAIPLAWSTDSKWLAFTREGKSTEVHLIPSEGGDEVSVGEGDKVSWRAQAPQLLVSVPSVPARVYTYDLDTRKTAVVARAAKLFFPVIEWDPARERFLYVESENAGREASGGVWLAASDGTGAMRVDQGRTVSSPQWSRDGSLLSALLGGDDVLVRIVDLISGRQVSAICRRAGRPPADCV